ncbi:hypothetical protein [Streptomyces sp. AcE210]|uniref:hypothetical protein n=1 Tax=Streptomyces sp. AcE210 TaxID=2292703 RepID=UPI000E30A0E0|nr:hypothetical protein [Streptomyces sp. AcE210]RFC77426.1 hypothetical protein DXZ75_05765 [Streptomyces sp. AcE210]
MTGSGDDWLSNGLDVESARCGLWVSGVEYVAGRRDARESADRLNRALLGAGFELSEVRAVASTDVSGRGFVRVAARLDAVDRLAALLETATGSRGGAV